MEAFVKSFSTYRTVKKASVIASALTLDSLADDTSTVTVVGTTIGRSNTGDWLIIDGNVYQISIVKPQVDRTLLTLVSPLDAFNRSIELEDQSEGQTIGGFVCSMLSSNWIACEDAAYAMPYLVVSNSDTTAFVPPEVDDNNLFDLPEYCRLMRQSYRVVARFADAGDSLVCSFSKVPSKQRQVSFEDGRSQLKSVDYSTAGTAKITVLRDVDSGEQDSEGNAILVRERSDWYLAEDGTISQSVPSRRALGKWKTIAVNEGADIPAKVAETFAKNKANHKLEFWSTIDLQVHDDCTFLVYGDLLYSYISCKRKLSEDKRYYYKSGELATTATEKLRGVRK